jgi:hypothetical protein
MGYTPLYDTMLSGTLYGRWPHTGIWACLLSRASREGVIDEVPASLAAAIGVSEELLRKCIHDFMQPDPGSRTKAHDGRRLELIDSSRDWGWLVLNHGKYREKARKKNYDENRTESGSDAERKRQERLLSKASRDVPTHPDASRDVPLSEAEAYKSPAKGKGKQKSQIPEAFVLTPEREHKANSLGVSNPKAEFAKFREYYLAKGTVWKDWDLVWLKWCRQTNVFSPSKANGKDPYANAI